MIFLSFSKLLDQTTFLLHVSTNRYVLLKMGKGRVSPRPQILRVSSSVLPCPAVESSMRLSARRDSHMSSGTNHHDTAPHRVTKTKMTDEKLKFSAVTGNSRGEKRGPRR